MTGVSAINILSRRGLKFDLIFLDPPYHKDILPGVIEIICKSSLLNESGVIAAEHDVRDILPDTISSFEKYKNAEYGDTKLSFYRWIGSKPAEE